MFALHPQQFATCGQQMDLPGSLKELLGDRGDCFDHVLAAVEDDKQLSRTDEIYELHARCVRFQHKSQGRSDGSHNMIWIGEASEVNEVDISAELFGNGVACGDSDSRLADATGAKQGDEALRPQVAHNLAEHLLPPNHPARPRGQWAMVSPGGGAGHTVADPGDSPDERVAASLNVRDVPVAEFAISERLADGGHVYPQAPLFDGHIGPDVIKQFLL